MHGIPEFRLPKEIVKQTIQKIIDLGLEVKYNYVDEGNQFYSMSLKQNSDDEIAMMFQDVVEYK